MTVALYSFYPISDNRTSVIVHNIQEQVTTHTQKANIFVVRVLHSSIILQPSQSTIASFASHNDVSNRMEHSPSSVSSSSSTSSNFSSWFVLFGRCQTISLILAINYSGPNSTSTNGWRSDNSVVLLPSFSVAGIVLAAAAAVVSFSVSFSVA